MRTLEARPGLRELTARLAAIEDRTGDPDGRRLISTGWSEVDATLPARGLRTAAVHEWHGLDGETRSSRWTLPLLILAHLGRRAMDADAGNHPWLVWIGRRTWLYGHAAIQTLGQTDRCLWIDAPDAGARAWAIEAALRCPGLIVVADGSGLESAASRRLQLAASAAGTIGFLARPMADLGEISFAATRWVVRACPAAELCNRWTLRLVRCKGLQAVDSPEWTIERRDNGWLGCLSPDVADRSRAAVAAS